MIEELCRLEGVVIAEVVGVDDGFPLVRVNQEVHRARVVWIKDAPDWSRCVGLRVAVTHIRSAEQVLILGLLDEPPQEKAVPKPRSLHIESGKELVIECGKSKIALRADGRIEIRGGHLVSRSSGPNKIKGGSVHIN